MRISDWSSDVCSSDLLDSWISGRKAFQSQTRQNLPRFEVEDGRIKLNPLGDWTKTDLEAYFEEHKLPRHPLEAEGYLSIGCEPCTDRKSVVEGKSVSVRVDLGGRRIIKKKNNQKKNRNR